MGDPTPGEGQNPDAASRGAPSLDDLDSLLASAADLAGELAQEVGSTESAGATAVLDAESLSETGDALSALDEQLSQVNELADLAVQEVGGVESTGGDTQVLAALESSAPPSAPPALSAADHALLADFDDLTTSPGKPGAADPFGAPPPRGGGPVSSVNAAATVHAKPVAADHGDAASALPVAADASTPHVAEPTRAAPESSKQAASAPLGNVLGLAARLVVTGLEACDSAFSWVPRSVKVLAGWAGITTSVIASAAWIYVLATKPPPIHRPEPPPAAEVTEPEGGAAGEAHGEPAAHASPEAPSTPASSSH